MCTLIRPKSRPRYWPRSYAPHTNTLLFTSGRLLATTVMESVMEQCNETAADKFLQFIQFYYHLTPVYETSGERANCSFCKYQPLMYVFALRSTLTAYSLIYNINESFNRRGCTRLKYRHSRKLCCSAAARRQISMDE